LALKDRMQFLTTPEQVDDFLRQHPQAAIFKAGTCHKTGETFRDIEPLLEARAALPLGVIRVLEARPASNRVAEVTGIKHESPQIVLFKDGRAVFDRDNWDITAEAVQEALTDHFPGSDKEPAAAPRGGTA
jgi:bacillithiol system protein YtxJ